MLITITGTPGSGKSTLGRILAQKLGYPFVSGGEMRGALAAKMRIDINELNRLGETGDTDTQVDNELIALCKDKDYVMDSYTAAHLFPQAFNVFVDANLDERARRKLKTKYKDESYDTLKHAKKAISERVASDLLRYKKHYNFNPYNHEHYDLILDSTKTSPEELVEQILKAVKKRNL
ncbi:MAG: cytidylate kinase family protein [Candidatus Woesearchaeota archaeon]